MIAMFRAELLKLRRRRVAVAVTAGALAFAAVATTARWESSSRRPMGASSRQSWPLPPLSMEKIQSPSFVVLGRAARAMPAASCVMATRVVSPTLSFITSYCTE